MHPPSCPRLVSYWAECEAGAGGDLAAARAVWEGALKGAAGRYADSWASYLEFERRRGHAREARTLYKRSYRWGRQGRPRGGGRRDRAGGSLRSAGQACREAAAEPGAALLAFHAALLTAILRPCPTPAAGGWRRAARRCCARPGCALSARRAGALPLRLLAAR